MEKEFTHPSTCCVDEGLGLLCVMQECILTNRQVTGKNLETIQLNDTIIQWT